MNGTNATQHRTTQRHLRIVPYDRQQGQRELALIVDDYFSIDTQQVNNLHIPCYAIYNCAYPDLNCFSKSCQRKRCYLE